MVRALYNEGGRETRSLILENNGSLSPLGDDQRVTSRSHASLLSHECQPLDHPKIGSVLDGTENMKSRLANYGSTANTRSKERLQAGKEQSNISNIVSLLVLVLVMFIDALAFVVWYNLDMELMKEKFSKLLLGEDMSGGGKGVSSALALSNAITNLAGIY